jgi:hypothetical protein
MIKALSQDKGSLEMEQEIIFPQVLRGLIILMLVPVECDHTQSFTQVLSSIEIFLQTKYEEVKLYLRKYFLQLSLEPFTYILRKLHNAISDSTSYDEIHVAI